MKKFLLLVLALGAIALTSEARALDKEFETFWQGFRTAVMANDKAAVADMTRFPYYFDNGYVNRSGFLKVFDRIFDQSLRKTMAKAEITKERKGYFVFCGEQILIFERTKSGYQFTETGVND